MLRILMNNKGSLTTVVFIRHVPAVVVAITHPHSTDATAVVTREPAGRAGGLWGTKR